MSDKPAGVLLATNTHNNLSAIVVMNNNCYIPFPIFQNDLDKIPDRLKEIVEGVATRESTGFLRVTHNYIQEKYSNIVDYSYLLQE